MKGPTFGKLNPRPVKKQAPAKSTKAKRSPAPAAKSLKLPFYLAGGILFLILAGYAFSF